MVPPPQEEASPLYQASSMAKSFPFRAKHSTFTDGLLFAGGALLAVVIVWSFWSFVNPNPTPNPSFNSFVPFEKDPLKTQTPKCAQGAEKESEPSSTDPDTPTFYDDPGLTYTIEKKLSNWDEKRSEWLRAHPWLAPGARERVLVVTGSQSGPCRNPVGDHMLLRFFKNKVDYCRLNGYEIFYNTALFQPKMHTFWAKIPLVRSAMVAHPEAEWIWWVDSDAAFTDMEFRLPLEKYRAHNLVVHGWSNLVYEQKSWVSLNAGVFLIRNCQWSIDFMEKWARMGPQTPEYDAWGKTLRATFKDKLFPESDDQSGLVYLLLTENKKWTDRIYLESEFYFEGYWLEIVGKLQNITRKYQEMEAGRAPAARWLRRRHAERMNRAYAAEREGLLGGAGYGKGSLRRPFITHFTGCQPCSGVHNEMYSGKSCMEGMERALNFADNQVLRNYGFVRKDVGDPSSEVEPLPFDYPARV